ncbi:MetQ/NlpA family ABC transporter substrate-binding protein [Fastidiosipila sanguinis]|uniref:Lipoprotein n=1 Tax=Fastidiosipila sanguinis TaxID=236753 RepID=A0A2S0KL52_9FIRM|nr:MetQ/NlpA family ABC transporter substrate-binding protein [Fastidiosipila sanguinis]AVM41741.1 methionine ABC transporter substrate-binding protein [Fastidiosipila sanguinis]
MKKFFKKFAIYALTLVSAITLVACQNSSKKTFTIGVVGDVERSVWEDVEKRLEADGEDIKIEVFSDYVMPNQALADGSIDMNAYQHVAYLVDYVKANKSDIVPVGYTYISPMAAYSENLKSLDELKDGDEVIIPNDPTNGGRALLLLEQAGVLEIDDAAGITPSTSNITSNPKNIKITSIDAAQIFIGIKDVAAVVANTNFAVDAGFDPYKDGIFVDTDNIAAVASQYKNVMAVKAADKESEIVKKVVVAYQSAATEAKIKEVSAGADQKAWSENDNISADFEAVLNQ